VKNQVLLVEAFGRVAGELPAVRLLLAGAGPERPALEARCRRLGIRERVDFIGWREDARTLLHGFDVFVLPSFSEGSPQSLLEAMGAGLPVVATGVGGSAESIVHGSTGFLVEPHDPADLAARLLDLARSPEERRRLGDNAARAIREGRTFDAMVGRYDELYRSLLGLPRS
jgi:glycosyltransferase involved in cell wall biosynthesis